MKVLLQWTQADPADYVVVDSSAWAALSRKPLPVGGEILDNAPGWIFDVCVQGISFGGADHYCVEDLADGSGGVRVTRWWDDPDDGPPGLFWAEVWTLLPLAHDRRLGGAINTRQRCVIYAAADQMARFDQNVEKTDFRPWEKFVPPVDPIHGIWRPAARR